LWSSTELIRPRIIGLVWVELVLALIVEGYHEFVEW
jgi:hypothetical protein